VKGHVIAAIDHSGAVLAVLAKNAAEDMDGRQDASTRPVSERRAVALVVAEIAVDYLAFEDISDHQATIAAAALHHDVAQAEIIEIVFLVLALKVKPVAFAASTQDIEPFYEQETHSRTTDEFQHVRAVGDCRHQSRAMCADSVMARKVATLALKASHA